MVPTASNMRRTSRFRLRKSVTRYQWLALAAAVLDRIEVGRSVFEFNAFTQLLDLFLVEIAQDTNGIFAHQLVARVHRRLASSPDEVVNSSRPLVLKSRRPTLIQRPLFMRGSASKTLARFSGSSRETISPSGLW